jgi:hypothetical protein
MNKDGTLVTTAQPCAGQQNTYVGPSYSETSYPTPNHTFDYTLLFFGGALLLLAIHNLARKKA